MRDLKGSVGKGAQNAPRDVSSVQDLLNLNARYLIPLRSFNVNGHCDDQLIEGIKWFQQRVVKMRRPDGRIDPGRATERALHANAFWEYKPVVHKKPIAPVPIDAPRELHAAAANAKPEASAPPPAVPAAAVAASRAGGKTYTTDPNELPHTRGDIDIPTLLQAIKRNWPELNDQGVKTIASQAMTECGHDKKRGGAPYCYCWNFGNIKVSKKRASAQYMMLPNTSEVLTSKASEEAIKNGKGLATAAPPEYLKKMGWTNKPGSVIMLFQPPHVQTKFCAFTTMESGVIFWTNFLKSKINSIPGLIDKVNAGDTAAVAKALHDAHYYTIAEKTYADSMKSQKARLDRM